jgi:N,N-dimethylformamidase beta subunit-like protein
VGRLLTALAAALAFAPAAHATSLAVEPRNFSPETGALAVSASLRVPQALGVQLATVRGRPIGWIKQPGRSQLVSLFWDGQINGVQVPDGYYLVRLVAAKRVVAAKSIRIDTVAPTLEEVSADNGSRPFGGDTSLLTTITPNGDGLRDRAELHFVLREPAFVQLEVSRTITAPQPIFTHRRWFAAGRQTLSWTPPAGVGPRTYLVHLKVEDAAGNSLKYGADSPLVGRYPRAPVIRAMGIDAAFGEPSYVAEQLAPLRIATDAPSLTLQFFHAGPEHVFTGADNVMNGVAVGSEVSLDWKDKQNGPAIARLGLGPWPSGLYYAQLTAPDGRVGYAPFVLRPAAIGAHRAAVILPTSTWQAYNFWDRTGDGWGDTWYAGAPHRTVELGRPYLRRGVIPFFRRYDLNFLHWLAWSGKEVDYLADTDLESIATGDELARAYDLVVFPGHTEYVQEHLYDLVSRYRDLGGNLAFLSANNFFWRVVQNGNVLRRTRLWRDLGRPEGALIGVQYIANDEGHRQGLFVIRDPAAAPWLWQKTGLEGGGTLGDFVGGYGIEIDATGPWSPAGTQVLAEIPELLGPSLTAQMSYYETAAGAKVFAAGVLDFGGSATFWPVSRMLENLWARLSLP